MSKLSYRPEIDGMRAISVLAVVLFHAGFGFSGGYVGVDVFFVISGFLITGLVLKEVRADRFRFVEFWERRIRRIFPACAVMVAVTLLAAIFLLLPCDTESLAKSAMAQMLLSANFYFLGQTGYFDGAAELKPLLHTWSLAVEEQFYLVFPWLLIFWRRLSPSQLFWRLLLVAVASFALSVWGTVAFPEWTFYMLPTRAWEMMIGGLLAVTVPTVTIPRRVNEGLSWLGLAGIFLAMLWYDHSTRFPGANSFLPCFAAGLLIFTNSTNLTSAGRLLSWPLLVWIGKLSYSLYLWHWPVLAFLRCRSGLDLPADVRLGAVVASFLLAWISWKFVETPLRSPVVMSRGWVYSLSTSCTLFLVAACGILMGTDGFLKWSPADVADVLENGEMSKRFQNEEIAAIGPALSPGESGHFLLWGDSHARAVSELVHELAIKHRVPGYVASRSATAPLLGTWRFSEDREGMEWNQDVFDFVKEKKIKEVILVGRWSAYVSNPRTALVDEETESPDEKSGLMVFHKALQKTVDELEDLGADVWLMQDVPEHPEDIRRMLAQRFMFDLEDEPRRVSLEEHRARQATTAGFLREEEGENVRVLDPAPLCFDQSGRARIWDDRLPFYSDSHHLSRYGARQLLAPFFDPIITEFATDIQFTKNGEAPSGTSIKVTAEPPVFETR